MRRPLEIVTALVAAAMLASPVFADNWYTGPLVRRSLEPPYRTQLDDSIYARSDCDPAVRPIEEGRARWISREQLDRAMAPVWPPRQAVALGGRA